MFKNRFFIFLSIFAFAFAACSSNDGDISPTIAPTMPVATTVPIVEPTAEPEEIDSEETDLSGFILSLESAVINENYAEMETLINDTIMVAPWRSEGRMIEASQMVEEFQNGSLPAPTAVTFTGLMDDEMTALIGQPPASLFGPDTNVVASLHSNGWGENGSDEAILFVTEVNGQYSWHGFLYTAGAFADANAAGEVVETEVEFIIAVQDVTMYDGPGEGFNEIGGIFDGQTAKVTGQFSENGWWRVICPDDTVGDCWVTNDNNFTIISEGIGDGSEVVETDVEFIIAMQDVTMYDGPGEAYNEIGGIADGQTAKVTGQDAVTGWWRVICPDDTIGDCWVTNDEAFTVPTG